MKIKYFGISIFALAMVVWLSDSRANIGFLVDPYWYPVPVGDSLPGVILGLYDNLDPATPRDPASDTNTGKKIDFTINELTNPRSLEDSNPPATKDPIFVEGGWGGAWAAGPYPTNQEACDAGSESAGNQYYTSGSFYGVVTNCFNTIPDRCTCEFHRSWTDDYGSHDGVFKTSQVTEVEGSMSCGPGYVLNGTVCNLTDPGAAQWPSNDIARIETIEGDSLRCIPNDPDCADIVFNADGSLELETPEGTTHIEYDPGLDQTTITNQFPDEWTQTIYDGEGNAIDSNSGYGQYQGPDAIRNEEAQLAQLEKIERNTGQIKSHTAAIANSSDEIAQNTADSAASLDSIDLKMDDLSTNTGDAAASLASIDAKLSPPLDGFLAPTEITDIGPGDAEANEMLIRLESAPIVVAVSGFSSRIVGAPPVCNAIEIDAFDSHISSDYHCQLWQQVSPAFSGVMVVAWSLLAGLVFMRA